MKTNVAYMCPFWTTDCSGRGYCRFDGTECHYSKGADPDTCRTYISIVEMTRRHNIDLDNFVLYPEGEDVEGKSVYRPEPQFVPFDMVKYDKVREWIHEHPEYGFSYTYNEDRGYVLYSKDETIELVGDSLDEMYYELYKYLKQKELI